MKALALVFNILGIPATFSSAWIAMFSPMILDSPQASESKIMVTIVYLIILFPLLSLIGEVVGWIFFYKENYKVAVMAYLPILINLLVIIGLLVIHQL